MATVSEVLALHPDYRGKALYRRMVGEDLAAAEWDPAATVPKPSMAEIDARRAAVDALLLDDAKQQRRRDRLLGEGGADALVRALHAICLDVEKLVTDLKPASFNGNVRIAAARVGTVRAQLARILADQD